MLRNSFKALTVACTCVLLTACAGLEQRGGAPVEATAAGAAKVVVEEGAKTMPVSAPVGVTIKERLLPHRTFDRQREEEYEEEEERIRHRHD